MPMPNPRTKLVNFRVSEDELEYVLEASRSVGFRSLSDFARTAVLQFSGVPEKDEELKVQLVNLDEKVDAMQSELHTLMAALGSHVPMTLEAHAG